MKKEEKHIILVGGGGHCKSVIDVIEKEGKFSIAGIVDIKGKIGNKVKGYKIMATDDDLPQLAKKYHNFLITVGHISSSDVREKIFSTLKKLNVNLPVIISPLAYVSESAKIGEGTVIMHHALVNAEAFIGRNCIINSKALVEHEAKIGDHCHVATRATVNGGCLIGEKCFIGSGSILFQGIEISDEVVVGAGSLVTEHIRDKGTYFGIPAQKRNHGK